MLPIVNMFLKVCVNILIGRGVRSGDVNVLWQPVGGVVTPPNTVFRRM